ncbi:MAG TPA: Na+/H+ antiporter subunit E [Polyangiaceae bacterium]
MTFLAKLLPAPLTSVALLVLWLLLARADGVGQVVLGLVLALGVPRLTSSLGLGSLRLRRPLVALRFVFLVFRDVLTSNVEVAWGVVTWRWRRPHSQFVIVPLDLRSPLGLATLSMVTTVVPGTVWSELALDRSSLLLHVWDVRDAGEFIARFKARYEKPLREIFE